MSDEKLVILEFKYLQITSYIQRCTIRLEDFRRLFNIFCYIPTKADNRSLKFFKKYAIIVQWKALNEQISEWSYFLNLDEQFQRYLHFSAPKKKVLWTRAKGKLHTWNGTKNNFLPITIFSFMFHCLVSSILRYIYFYKNSWKLKWYVTLQQMQPLFSKWNQEKRAGILTNE